MKEGVPIQPTAHYAMGGIPTDVQRASRDQTTRTRSLPGMYAAGEVACVSVHGANRLGTNSLVDLIVFGRRGGKAMAEFAKQADLLPLPQRPGRLACAKNSIASAPARARKSRAASATRCRRR